MNADALAIVCVWLDRDVDSETSIERGSPSRQTGACPRYYRFGQRDVWILRSPIWHLETHRSILVSLSTSRSS